MDMENKIILNRIVGHIVINIIYVYWEQDDVGFKCIEWIILEFDNDLALVFTAGEFGDNISIFDYSIYKPRNYLDARGCENVKDVYINKNDDPVFSKFIGKEVLGYELVPLVIVKGKRVYDIAVILTTSNGKFEIGLQDPDNMRIKIVQ